MCLSFCGLHVLPAAMLLVYDMHLCLVCTVCCPGAQVSTQNVAKSCKMGAFTGEVCAPMIKDFGLEWVSQGAMERRFE